MDRLCKVGDIIRADRLSYSVPKGAETIILHQIEVVLSNPWLVVNVSATVGTRPDEEDLHSVIVRQISILRDGFLDKMPVSFEQTGCPGSNLEPHEIELIEEVNIVKKDKAGKRTFIL